MDPQAAAAQDWNALFDLIGARLAATAKTAQDARIKQRDLDQRIAVLRQQLQREPPEEWERTEIRIHIEASAPAKGIAASALSGGAGQLGADLRCAPHHRGQIQARVADIGKAGEHFAKHR